jgi:hypothetical protein
MKLLNIIIFFIVLITLVLFLRRSQEYKETFLDVPDSNGGIISALGGLENKYNINTTSAINTTTVEPKIKNNDTYAYNPPKYIYKKLDNLAGLADNTLVIAFQASPRSNWERVFDFNSSDNIQSYIFLTSNYGGVMRTAGRINYGAENPIVNFSQGASAGNQYIALFYITNSQITLSLNTFNNRKLEPINRPVQFTQFNNKLSVLNTLYFGKSAYGGDPYFSGSYQKIALFSGNFINEKSGVQTKTLIDLMATPNNYNSQTGIYRFAVPNTTRLRPVGVNIYGAKYDDKQISMSGSRQYAQLTKIGQ